MMSSSVEMTAQKYAAFHPRFMKDGVQTVEFGRDMHGNGP